NNQISVSVGDISVYIAKSDTANVVGSIGLNDYQSRKLPSIKYLLDSYGIPCGVLSTGDPKDIILIYPHMEVRSVSSEGRLSVDSPAEAISIGGEEDQCQAIRQGERIVLPWLGFTTLSHYKARGITSDGYDNG